MNRKLIKGDCREVLATLPEKHFHCCVTSPPYFGLRDYGVDGQIGLEPSPDEFVAVMAEVLRGVWRVLRDDGVCWVNLGDSYSMDSKWGGSSSNKNELEQGYKRKEKKGRVGLPDKNLIGIPWKVAFALQADGWYLRDAVIWHKPAPMPGSQRDRCTSSYEFIFQLTKKQRYFFDLEAVKEPCSPNTHARISQDLANQVGSHRANGGGKTNGPMKAVLAKSNRKLAEPGSGIAGNKSYESALALPVSSRAPRNVWTIASEGFSDTHFATFPVAIPIRCIQASTSDRGCCPECGAPWERVVEKTSEVDDSAKGSCFDKGKTASRDGGERTQQGERYKRQSTGWQPTCDHNQPPIPCRVLDPFNGAGTTGLAARQLGRDYTGIELNPEYIELTHKRWRKEQCGKQPKLQQMPQQKVLF